MSLALIGSLIVFLGGLAFFVGTRFMGSAGEPTPSASAVDSTTYELASRTSRAMSSLVTSPSLERRTIDCVRPRVAV